MDAHVVRQQDKFNQQGLVAQMLQRLNPVVIQPAQKLHCVICESLCMLSFCWVPFWLRVVRLQVTHEV